MQNLNLKLIIKSLLKRKLFSALTILQFIIVFIITFKTFLIYENNVSYVKKIGTLININNSVNLQENLSERYFSRSTIDDEKKLYEYIENHNSVKNMGTFIFSEFNSNQFRALNSKVKSEKTTKSEAKSSYVIPILLLDKNLNKFISLNIASGRGLLYNDFSYKGNQLIPVIAGYNFKNVINIGDEIVNDAKDTNGLNVSYKVVGFLQKDSCFFKGGGKLVNNIENLDNALIAPININSFDNQGLVKLRVNCNLIYVIKDNSNMKKVINDIDNKAVQLGLGLSSEPISSQVKEFGNDDSYGFMKYLLVSSIISVFSIIGLLGSLVISMAKRRYELGIRISIGASKFHILQFLIGELLVLLSISFAITTIFFLVTGSSIWNMSFYNIGIVILDTLIIFFIIIVFAVTIALLKIFRMQPSDLILRRD